MQASASYPLHTYGYADDLLDALAGRIIARHADRLPDLTGITVLLPQRQAITRLRRQLLVHAQARGVSALLGPEIDSFSGWLGRQPGGASVLSDHQRELMLVEALVDHPYLYGEGNPWMLADSLLQLFDELTAAYFNPPERLEDFLSQIGGAYGVANLDNQSLVGEARLVHTLWQAWHRQFAELAVVDRPTDQLLKLHATLQQLPATQQFYLAGFDHLTPAQVRWLQPLLTQGRLHLLLQGEPATLTASGYHAEQHNQRLAAQLGLNITFPEPADEVQRLLGSIYSPGDEPLRDRALAAAAAMPASPLAGRLRLFAARGAEQEARAVDLQVRLWWLEGKRSIGIVTENRRLARRVRALLERAGIALQDAAGWALSTTSAAAVLERWLETLEEDFAHQPLLDLLKSPLVFPDRDRAQHLATVYLFEQGIVLHENIARGLNRYRAHTLYRQKRLPENLAAEYQTIHSLLDSLDAAAAPLRPFINGRTHAPHALLDALHNSLRALGLDVSLAGDAAGQRILEELQQLRAAAQQGKLRMQWREFRTWLGRTLERGNFQPPDTGSLVQLMSLAQSSLSRFDAVIIAGAEREYLPASPGASPFFNDGVRRALGLNTRAEALARRQYQFRQLLASAPQLLITWRREEAGEHILPSPWIERLRAFHAIAYGDDLHDDLRNDLGNDLHAERLATLLSQPGTQVTTRSARLPTPIGAHPVSRIDAALFPRALSASGYQQLMDCPFQFFAARCLKLSPPESVRELLAKSDYGERVHLCLQAFHGAVSYLPGPFTAAVTAANRDAAIATLTEITTRVFARDLEDNFLHRGWRQRWLDSIPAYIDWQIERQTQWQVSATEAEVEAALPDSAIMLRGRLDRIDRGTHGLGIIDYKTGTVPRDIDTAILDGEAVQLPFYGLLAEQHYGEPVARVEFLTLEKQQTQSRGTLTEVGLDEARQHNARRLRELCSDMQQGQALPAWGDEVSCSRCQMSGICRREVWL